MTSPLQAAAIQMNSGSDPAENRRAAIALVERAAADGARLIVLPETFACMGPPALMVQQAEPVPGPTSEMLANLARRLGVTLVAGSICERSSQPDKCFNTSLLFAPDGALLAKYRKRHLFDLEIPGQVACRESSWSVAGDELCVTDTACGRLGQAICYDLRFPEMFRRLAELGAEIVTIPSAFTLATGRDHWEVLLRARAIENQCYVIAPNQYGQHGPNHATYGRSMIIDPWGTVLATASDGVSVARAEIDVARVAAVRERLPALAHRRDIPNAR